MVNKEIISKITNMGYKIESYNNIIGLPKIKKFKTHKFTKKGSLTLMQDSIYTKMYSSDPDLQFLYEQKSR